MSFNLINSFIYRSYKLWIIDNNNNDNDNNTLCRGVVVRRTGLNSVVVNSENR